MGFETKPNLVDGKFEQCSSDILTLCGNTKVTGTFDIHPSGSIDSCSGYKISGATFLRASLHSIDTVYIGRFAGSDGTGDMNIGIGCQTLSANGVGNNNIGFGFTSLSKNSSGCHNTAIGSSSLYNNLNGNWNTAIGFCSLYSNTSGCYNIGIGGYTLNKNATGNWNTAVGQESLYCVINGSYNTALGYRALYNATGSSGNVGVGKDVLFCNTKGYENVGVGANALDSVTTGCYNTAIGSYAGHGNYIGCCNVYIGYNAGWSDNSSNKLYIANNSSCTLIYGNFTGNTVTLPTICVCNTPTTGSSGDGILVWNSVDKCIKQVTAACVVGTGGIQTANNGLEKIGPNVRLGGALTGNTNIRGAYTLSICGGAKLNTTCGYQISGSTVLRTSLNNINAIYIGNNAGSVGGTGTANFGVGNNTMLSLTSGAYNTGIGEAVLRTTTTGSYNTGFGLNALYNNFCGCNNFAVGNATLLQNTCGCSNVGIGAQALNKNTAGHDNIAIGSSAVCANITSSSNIGIGAYSLYQTTGFYNTGVGHSALYSNVGGQYNIALGTEALYGATTGCMNIALGLCTGYQNASGCGNVYLGKYAGSGNTRSNKLYIANQKSCTLIYGDFTGNTVTLPTICVCNTPTTGSSSDGILVWNSVDKCIKQVAAATIIGGTSSMCTMTITGNGTATGFTVNHAMNTQFPMVQVIKDTAPYPTVYTDNTRPNANCVCIMFDTAPVNLQAYRVLIIK